MHIAATGRGLFFFLCFLIGAKVLGAIKCDCALAKQSSFLHSEFQNSLVQFKSIQNSTPVKNSQLGGLVSKTTTFEHMKLHLTR